MPINVLGKAGAQIRVIVFVIFLKSCVTGMSKEMESGK